MNFAILYCADQSVLFLLVRPLPNVGARSFRAIPLTVELKRANPAQATPYPCAVVGTALSALYRVHALCNVHRLTPSLRAWLVPDSPLADARPWVADAGSGI